MDQNPEIPTSNTIMPRHLAAIFDNMIAAILGLAVVKFLEASDTLIDEKSYKLQLLVFVTVYLGYFFVFEKLISRTPGKLLTGLVVVRKDGSKISTLDVVVRTILRPLEVNPALFGYAPAALSIIFSKNHQRIADRIVGTIVVPPDRLP